MVAGTYSVTVSDQAGCTVVATGVIPEPEVLTASATASPTDCGIDNGSISVVVAGGNGNYDFDWPGTANDGVQSPGSLGAGSYEVTITDDNGCTVLASADVITPDGPLTSVVGIDVDCNGASTGSIDLTITGGATPYDIDWGDPNLDGNEDIADLPAGTYQVVVTDANNCSSISTIEIIEPDILQLNTSTTPLTCAGSNDGTATATVIGGTAPYTYLWCDGQTGQTALNCIPGPCQVIITDANGCTIEETVFIDEPAPVEALAATIDADCNAANTGSIDLTVSGGTGPGTYTFTWTNGIGDVEDPTDIGANSYDVVVTDANGCTTEVLNIIINEPPALSLSFVTTEATCNEANGSIDLTVVGGTPPYTYTWTGGLPNVEDPIDLITGSYDVEVMDANGCTITGSAVVSTPDALSIANVATDVDCNGANTGSIDVTVSGGTAPFSYQWDDLALQTTEDANDLIAGNYTLIVTDANGCTITTSAQINEPTAIQLSATSTDATCNTANGTIDLTVIGGTPPYSFDWSGAAADVEDPIDLVTGSYNVTVTDANGCIELLTQEVSTPSGLAVNTVGSDVSCFGSSDGSIELDVSGGVPPFTYQWDDPNLQTAEDPIDLPAGEYNVVVTDSDGCTIVASATINQPNPIVLSSTTTDAFCGDANGTIDLTVVGGTAPYSYSWSSGLPGIEDPAGVFSGSYDVLVTDANGCTEILTVVVVEPNALSLSATSVDALCNGDSNGSGDLTVSGGNPPYTYQWDDQNAQTTEDISNIGAGTYTVVVTDSDGCTISTSITIDEPDVLEANNLTPSMVSCNGGNDGSATIVVTGGSPGYTFDWSDDTFDGQDAPTSLSAGTYTVTVTDLNGCTALEQVVISEPPVISLSTASVAAQCFGAADGSIDLSVVGGTAPYTFSWNNGSDQEDPQNVASGNYTVIVTDANGCTETTSVFVDQPNAIAVNIENISNYGGVNVTCSDASDGSAEAVVSGGVAPFSYVWSNGVTSSEIENIGVGVYQVTITDANGCTAENQVELTGPPAVEVAAEIIDPSCFGENDGAIILEGIGGTAPYLFALEGEPLSTLNLYGGLTSGTYNFTVEDVNGCEENLELTVVDPPELLLDLGEDVEIFMGDSIQLDPIVNAFVLDTFSWRRPEVTDFNPWVQPFETTTYYMTVVNEQGCVAEDEIQVRVNKDRLIYIPNVFTPNDDGFNDVFMIHGGQGVELVRYFRIFNRWGELVFEAENFDPKIPTTEFGWDGRFKNERMNPAVFVYVAEVLFIDGRVEMYKGDVTLTK